MVVFMKKNDCESCGRMMKTNEARWAFIYPKENKGPTAQENCESCMYRPLGVLKAVELYLKEGNKEKAIRAVQDFANEVDSWEDIEPEGYDVK